MNEMMEPAGNKDISNYDPAESAMEIHASEAAIRAAKRAKDVDAIANGIDVMLNGEAKFASEYKAIYIHGGDRTNQDDSSVVLQPEEYCEQFGFNLRGVQRWGKALLNEEGGLDSNKIQNEYMKLLEKTLKNIGMVHESTGSSHVSNSDNHWYTPSQYIESARSVMGTIDLDPATSDLAQKIIKAKVFHTVKDNGLEQKWAGNVWMNPPYSMPEVELFINKLLSEPVNEWIVLTNNSSDTGWYHLLLSACTSICIPKGRIGFVNKEGKVMATRQGQTFFYHGKNIGGFIEEFSPYGRVLHVN